MARTHRDLRAARRLLREYGRWLIAHREVTNFEDTILERGMAIIEREIVDLPGEFGPPRGALLLAFVRGTAVGCAALRSIDARTGELRRFYVRLRYRGLGLGRRLTTSVLNRARRLDYDRVVLDTLPKMTSAIRLYQDMGFRQISAYKIQPVKTSLFFEYRLNQPTAARTPRRTSGRRRVQVRSRKQVEDWGSGVS